MADTADKLALQVAAHLTAQAVKIRWQTPAAEGADGQAYRLPGGSVLIDISDDLKLDDKYRVLLHELAHVRLKHHLWADVITGVYSARAGIKRSDAQRQAWHSDIRERDANKLAQDWIDYAERNAWRYAIPGERKIIACLKALLDWQNK